MLEFMPLLVKMSDKPSSSNLEILLASLFVNLTFFSDADGRSKLVEGGVLLALLRILRTSQLAPHVVFAAMAITILAAQEGSDVLEQETSVYRLVPSLLLFV